MKRKVFMIIFALVLFVFGITSIDAATMNYKGSYAGCCVRDGDYITNVMHMSGEGYAYCLKGNAKDYPPIGANMSKKETITKGRVLCVLDKGGATTNGTTNYMKTQYAVWIVTNTVASVQANNISASTKNAATALANQCTDNNYVSKSTMTLAATPTLKRSGNNYIADVKVNLAGGAKLSGCGTLNITGATGTWSKVDDTTCRVTIPVSSVTGKVSISGTITGTGTEKYYERWSDGYPANQHQEVAIIKSRTANLSVAANITINAAKVYKTDTSGNKLSGGSFRLYTDNLCTKLAKDKNGQTINAQSMVDGELTFSNLPDSPTKYYVYETLAPEGYDIDQENNCQEVTLNGSVTMRNVKIQEATIQVRKVNSYTGEGISKVEIGLYSDQNCGTLVEKKTTSGGSVKFGPIEYNEGDTPKYWVKEIKTPTGFSPEKGSIKCIAVPFSNNKFGTVTIKNAPYGEIKILKVETEDRIPIAGVEFELLDSDKKPAKDKDGQVVKSIKTDDQGNASFKNIPYGVYYIHEINHNKHYKVIEDIALELNEHTDAIFLAKLNAVRYVVGDVNGDNKVDAADLTELNRIISTEGGSTGLPKAQAASADINQDGIINKDDADLLDKKLNPAPTPEPTPSGDDSGDGSSEGSGEGETPVTPTPTPEIDEKEKALLERIGTTQSLPVEEIKATVVIVNELIKTRISKQDIISAEEVPGAEIVIKDKDGKEVEKWISGTEPKEFTLEYGEYTLIETVAPEGYDRMKTKVNFEVTTDGKTKITSVESPNYEVAIINGLEHLIIYNSKKDRPKQEVPIPDTGSVISIVGTGSGIALIGFGLYTMYRRKKSA